MTPHHRSQTTIVQPPQPLPPRTRIRVLSPALERWQVALILGVSEKTIKRWGSQMVSEVIGKALRYPAFENGLIKFIEVVDDPKEATPRPR